MGSIASWRRSYSHDDLQTTPLPAAVFLRVELRGNQPTTRQKIEQGVEYIKYKRVYPDLATNRSIPERGLVAVEQAAAHLLGPTSQRSEQKLYSGLAF